MSRKLSRLFKSFTGTVGTLPVVLQFFITSTATSTYRTIRAFNRAYIFGCKFVSTLAMSFLGIFRRNAFSTHNVFSISNNFNVDGINTTPIAAKVIANPVWTSNKQSISKTVSTNIFSTNTEVGISSGQFSARPVPTTSHLVNCNFRKQTGEKNTVKFNVWDVLQNHIDIISDLIVDDKKYLICGQ